MRPIHRQPREWLSLRPGGQQDVYQTVRAVEGERGPEDGGDPPEGPRGRAHAGVTASQYDGVVYRIFVELGLLCTQHGRHLLQLPSPAVGRRGGVGGGAGVEARASERPRDASASARSERPERSSPLRRHLDRLAARRGEKRGTNTADAPRPVASAGNAAAESPEDARVRRVLDLSTPAGAERSPETETASRANALDARERTFSPRNAAVVEVAMAEAKAAMAAEAFAAARKKDAAAAAAAARADDAERDAVEAAAAEADRRRDVASASDVAVSFAPEPAPERDGVSDRVSEEEETRSPEPTRASEPTTSGGALEAGSPPVVSSSGGGGAAGGVPERADAGDAGGPRGQQASSPGFPAGVKSSRGGGAETAKEAKAPTCGCVVS